MYARNNNEMPVHIYSIFVVALVRLMMGLGCWRTRRMCGVAMAKANFGSRIQSGGASCSSPWWDIYISLIAIYSIYFVESECQNAIAIYICFTISTCYSTPSSLSATRNVYIYIYILVYAGECARGVVDTEKEIEYHHKRRVEYTRIYI